MKLPGLALLGVCAAACQRDPIAPPPAPSRPAAGGAPIALTLLYTADEHGWIAPTIERGRQRGGAAELATRWAEIEGLCNPTGGAVCDASAALALSGGDNWTGPAISSYWRGQPAADAFGRVGWAASALGNHELDFGRSGFVANRALMHLGYLAANVQTTSGETVASPMQLFRRNGVTVGVVGLATRSTPQHGLRENYAGLVFSDEEKALVSASEAAYAAGADVVVVIAHVCGDELAGIVAKHPELGLGFAGGGHCHRLGLEDVHGTPVANPGAFLRSYVRDSLVVDLSRPARHRVVKSTAEIVDLTRVEGASAPVAPNPTIASVVEAAQKKTDQALGEIVGYTAAPLEPDGSTLTKLILGSWRKVVPCDVATINKHAMRQIVPIGPISLQTIYSLLPFDNQLVTVKVSGALLVQNMRGSEGHFAGASKRPDGSFALDDGTPIDAAKTYTVLATDYAYSGGSGYTLDKEDKAPITLGDWRDPIVKYLREHPTTKDKSIDALVAEGVK